VVVILHEAIDSSYSSFAEGELASYRIAEAANNGMGSAAIVGAATAGFIHGNCPGVRLH
jgi:hypothetical protein